MKNQCLYRMRTFKNHKSSLNSANDMITGFKNSVQTLRIIVKTITVLCIIATSHYQIKLLIIK